jgi:hypothetical protein
MFLAVVDWDKKGNLKKYQSFKLRSDADNHMLEYGGFVCDYPDINLSNLSNLTINPLEKRVFLDKTLKEIKKNIKHKKSSLDSEGKTLTLDFLAKVILESLTSTSRPVLRQLRALVLNKKNLTKDLLAYELEQENHQNNRKEVALKNKIYRIKDYLVDPADFNVTGVSDMYTTDINALRKTFTAYGYSSVNYAGPEYINFIVVNNEVKWEFRKIRSHLWVLYENGIIISVDVAFRPIDVPWFK